MCWIDLKREVDLGFVKFVTYRRNLNVCECEYEEDEESCKNYTLKVFLYLFNSISF